MGPTGEESRHGATGGEPRCHRPESAQSHPHSGLPGPAQGKLECSHANTVSFTVLCWETFSRSLHGIPESVTAFCYRGKSLPESQRC